MTKLFPITIWIILCLNSMQADAQKLNWINSSGYTYPNANDESDAGLKIVTDRFGKIYSIGNFMGDSLKIGNIKLMNTSKSTLSSYIARYDSSGKLIWAKAFLNERFNYLAVDSIGNVYIASNNDNGGELLKMDSAGKGVWIKSYGSISWIRGFYVDKKGNSYLFGDFFGNNIQIGKININSFSKSAKTFFVSKFDSSGNVLFAKAFAGTNGTVYQENVQIGVDAWGNLYIADGIVDNVTVGNKIYYNTYRYKSYWYFSDYLAKFDDKGNLLWSKFLNFDSNYGLNLAVNAAGNIFMAAMGASQYMGDAQFDNVNLDPNGRSQWVLVKFDSSGHALWGRHIFRSDGTAVPIEVNSPLYLDPNGDIYIAGAFMDGVQFGNTIYNFSLNRSGIGFIAKYNTLGKEQWLLPLGYGGSPCPSINSIATGTKSEVYFTGQFAHTGKFDTYTFNAIGSSAIMTGKISDVPVILPDSMGYTYSCVMPIKFFLYYNTTPDSIIWNFGDSVFSNLLSPDHLYLKSGKYATSVTAFIKGQTKTFQKTINFNGLTGKNMLPADTFLCAGATLNIDLSNRNATKILWNDSIQSLIRMITIPGLYFVTLNNGQCFEKDSINVLIDTIHFSLGVDTSLCDTSFIIKGPAWPGAVYVWNTGSISQSLSVTASGNYKLTMQKGMCSYKDSIKVAFCQCFIYTPNSFTPDANNHNDSFKSVSECIPEKFEMIVYNRWGEKLFHSFNIKEGWDGSFNGSLCPNGIYIWSVNYKMPNQPGQISKGLVEILL